MSRPVPDEVPTPRGDVVYREPARAWTPVWLLLAGLVAVFAVDRSVAGSGIPVGAWLLIIGLVVGAYAVLVASVRASRSLMLTTDELWVGEEVLLRTQISGAPQSSTDEDELPVLGWPAGVPRRMKGLTVRTVDGQDIVIPTRHAEMLQIALGLTVINQSPVAVIRTADERDLAAVPEIAERAELLFELAGHDRAPHEFDMAALEDAVAVFVADDPPLGFVWLHEIDGADGVAHLEHLAVTPSAMRKGLGTALLEHACDWARDAGYATISLVADDDVPWQGPFFRARGFTETVATGAMVAMQRAL